MSDKQFWIGRRVAWSSHSTIVDKLTEDTVEAGRTVRPGLETGPAVPGPK